MAAGVLTRRVEDGISDAELEAERGVLDPPIRTREELAYFRIFREHLPGADAGSAVGRFATA